MKKLPQRTCMGCNSKKDKNELIRIVKNSENEIFVDISGKQNGRGAYICNNSNCLEKLIKRMVLPLKILVSCLQKMLIKYMGI